MILCIADVLSRDEAADLRRALERAPFEDGRATAGWNARQVKRNTQLPPRSPQARALARVVAAALRRNPVFELAVRPKAVRPILFARYEPGMQYGTHVDDAVMSRGASRATRSDVSFTLFLADPASYDGGELVMEGPQGEQAFKLDPGALVAYPSSSLHRVEPVTRGVRLVAVGWAQSLVRDPARRELLFDLDTARRTLFERHGKTREFDLLSKTFANLLRMWAEP
ncbi:MAG TPA: Fe2+-dependent dioxygenase [Thermodesulfobacteriota bacterium]